MSLSGLQFRTTVIHQVRNYLLTHGFEEIEPQYLSSADTLEPTIYPFKVDDLYLPTSPESFLKQAIAAGLGNCFAISHTFRNLEGQGRIHSPEFIMAEWYQQDVDYRQMITQTQDLIASILPLSKLAWPIFSWRKLWRQAFSTPLDDLIDDQAMINFAQKNGCTTVNATWEQLFNQLADNYITKQFPNEPFFLVDYPARISPLAKPRHDLADYAERFELFIDGIELANGNTESFDVHTISSTMQTERASRGGPLNHSFLNAIGKLTGQTWAGVGLGIDRLAMILGKFDHIKSVQASDP